MNKFKLIIFLSIIIASVCCFFKLYKHVYFTPNFKYSKNEYISTAAKELNLLGFPVHEKELDILLKYHKNLDQFIERNYTGDIARDLRYNQFPTFYWHFTWDHKKHKHQKNKKLEGIEKITIDLNDYGMLGFHVDFYKDSLNIKNYSETLAMNVADSLIAYLSLNKDCQFESFERFVKEQYVDYDLKYKFKQFEKIKSYVKVYTSGTNLAGYKVVYDIPEFEDNHYEKIYQVTGLISVLVLFIVFIVTIFIKKLRKDELSFKNAFPVTIIVIIATLTSALYINPESLDIINYVISLTFLPLVLGIIFLVSVSTTDSLSREIWRGKLVTFDTLSGGKIFYRRFGDSLFSGITFGTLLVFIITGVLFLLRNISSIDLSEWTGKVNIYYRDVPVFYNIASAIQSVCWEQFLFILFPISILARYIGRKRWLVLTMFLFWGVFASVFVSFVSFPLPVSMLITAILGLTFTLLFIRIDLLSSITAHFVFLLLLDSGKYLFSGNIHLVFYGFSILGLLLIVAGISLYALRFDLQPDVLNKYTPSHVKHMLERERLERELEIAKRVQLGLLPESNPKVNGVDIAATCIPALDVGGDYYDFVVFEENKLGLAIGDVSGKGISAAFYMTLTKGFLRSLTKFMLSPKQVLMQINSLFYENVKRGHFISMVYGVFDFEKMTFCFSRAGHNPVITLNNLNGKCNIICPKGLAMGLDKGEIFDNIIQEKSIALKSQDIFVFYTDGFSEAMNSSSEVFGEEKICELLNKYSNLNSSDILKNVTQQVFTFMNKKEQHDDMTMIIVKINKGI